MSPGFLPPPVPTAFTAAVRARSWHRVLSPVGCPGGARSHRGEEATCLCARGLTLKPTPTTTLTSLPRARPGAHLPGGGGVRPAPPRGPRPAAGRGQSGFRGYRCTQGTLLSEYTCASGWVALPSACCLGDPEFALDPLPRRPSWICELRGAIVHTSLVHLILALVRPQIAGGGVGARRGPGFRGQAEP